MNLPRTWRRRSFLVAVALLLLLGLCVATGFGLSSTSTAMDHERRAAEERWSNRPFERYRLVLRDRFCTQDAEIYNEEVVLVHSNTCESRARSISDLFDLIERDGSLVSSCVAGGCACDDILLVSASYDPLLGYPDMIDVRVEAQANLRHPDYWRLLIRTGELSGCSVPVGWKTISVISLTPLQ